jgi:hypothetical protein
MTQAYKVEPVRHMSGAVVGYNVIHRETRDVMARCVPQIRADSICWMLNNSKLYNRESNG